jgi:hypothetical protein
MKEKSIRRVYKRSTIITFILIAIVGVHLGIYFNEGRQNDRINNYSTVSVRLINDMVSSLNRINVMSLDSSEETFAQFSQIDAVREELTYFQDKADAFLNETEILGFDYASKQLSKFPELVFTNKKSAPYVSLLGDMAREISGYRNQRDEELKNISNNITIISFVMLVFILIILIVSYTFQNKYFISVDNTIEEMKSLVDGKSITPIKRDSFM